MFLDQEITEKGIGREKTFFWNNLGQPAYTGRVRYERGYKTERTPLAQSVYILPSNPADALILTQGDQSFHQEKGERENALEKAWIKVEGPGIWISHRFLVSSLKVP